MTHPARRRPAARRSATSLWVVLAISGLSAALFAGTVQDASLADAIAEQRARAYGANATAESLNDLGNLLVLDKQSQAAIEAYREALAKDPSHLPAGFNLGLLLDSGGEAEASLTTFQDILGYHPEHARTHYQVGSLLERAGRDRLAIDSYVRAFELDPFLALPDVNPQITDNDLVTEALLRVKVEADAQDDAPRIYSEPSRVASLLLPSPERPAEAPEPAATEGAMASDEASTLRSLGVEAEQRQLGSGDLRSVDVPAASTTPAGDDAVLESRRNDLRARAADDAETRSSAPAQAESEPEAAPAPTRTLSVRDLSSSRVNQAGPSTGAGSTRRPTARSPAPTNTRRPSANRTAPSRPRSTSPTRFRPGRRSSAQLDLRLVPTTPQPADAASATRAGD